MTIGPFDGLYGYYFEHKYNQNTAMQNALPVIQEVYDRFAGAHRPAVPARDDLEHGRCRRGARGGQLRRRQRPFGGREAARRGRQGRRGQAAHVPTLPQR